MKGPGNSFGVWVRLRALLSVLLAVMAWVGLYGCSTTREVFTRVLPGGERLSKKVAVLPLEDRMGLGSEETRRLSARWFQIMSGSDDLQVTELRPEAGAKGKASLEGDAVGGLMKRCEDVSEGTQAVVVGILNPVEITERYSGVWPFNKWRRIYTFSMTVRALDVAQGTLLLERRFSEEEEVALKEARKEPDTAWIARLAPSVLEGIVEDGAEEAVRTMEHMPWRGVVLKVGEKAITVRGGAQEGMREGLCLEVLALGQPIRARSGLEYRPVERKVGKVRVAEVRKQSSICQQEAGGPFETGQVVQPCP